VRIRFCLFDPTGSCIAYFGLVICHGIIDGTVKKPVADVKGNQVQIRTQAPDDVMILREEIAERRLAEG